MCQGMMVMKEIKAVSVCVRGMTEMVLCVCMERRGSVLQDNCKGALKEYCSTQLIKECSTVCAGTNSNQFYLFVDSRFVSRPVSNTQNTG